MSARAACGATVVCSPRHTEYKVVLMFAAVKREGQIHNADRREQGGMAYSRFCRTRLVGPVLTAHGSLAVVASFFFCAPCAEGRPVLP